MPEYINLNPVIREISDVQNNILLLNGKMDTMGAQVGAVTQDLNTTRQKLQELAEAFEKFSRQAERIAVVQRAETQLGNLKSELDRVYGHYALVRRTSVGVLQAFDVGNVTNDVVAQVSEELMIQSPRYWLAPALVGLAAWSQGRQGDLRKVRARGLYPRCGKNLSLLCAHLTARQPPRRGLHLAQALPYEL